jgi:hypothetical protein
MPKKYYDDATLLSRMPLQINEIIGRIITWWIQDLIYVDLPFSEAKEHIYLSDITAGQSGRANIRRNRKSQWVFPATHYSVNITPVIDDTRYNKRANSENVVYLPRIGRYIQAVPMQFELPCITFFNNINDYMLFYKILYNKSSKLIRLFVPIVIDGVETEFPIDLTMPDIGQTEFGGNFEAQLDKGNINDINHTTLVKYFEYTGSDITVTPVEDMILSVYNFNQERGDGSLKYSNTLAPNLEVVSTNPEDDDTNVSVSGEVTITFNNPIDENYSKAGDYIGITPYVDGSFDTLNSGEIVTFTPFISFESGTVYNFEIAGDITDIHGGRLFSEDEGDTYDFSFTTI